MLKSKKTLALVAIFALTTVTGTGCGDKADEKPADKKTAASGTDAAEAFQVVPTDDEEATLVAAARKEVTDDNAAAIADALAKEIEAELASE